MPSGHLLGPRKICAELSSNRDVVLPGRTETLALCNAQGLLFCYFVTERNIDYEEDSLYHVGSGEADC